MAMMEAAVLHGHRDLRLERVPVPAPAAGELLIEVTAVGICGTDAAEWGNGPRLLPVEVMHPVTGHVGPIVMGHEFAGRVVGIGEGVDDRWIGRLVASCGAVPCGRCGDCVGGRSNVCREYAAVGLHRDGALAQFVAAPAASCVDVGELGVDAYDAALVQPMSIAVHASRRSGVRSGDVAVVQGIGGVGAFLVHVLTSIGARVIAVDVVTDRLEVARELGAEIVVLGATATTGDELVAAWGAERPVFFEVTGAARALALAIDIVPMGTTIILVGIAKEPVILDAARTTVRELALIGTNAMVRETDLVDAAHLVAARSGKWGAVAPPPVPFLQLVDGVLRPIVEGRPPGIKSIVLPPSP